MKSLRLFSVGTFSFSEHRLVRMTAETPSNPINEAMEVIKGDTAKTETLKAEYKMVLSNLIFEDGEIRKIRDKINQLSAMQNPDLPTDPGHLVTIALQYDIVDASTAQAFFERNQPRPTPLAATTLSQAPGRVEPAAPVVETRVEQQEAVVSVDMTGLQVSRQTEQHTVQSLTAVLTGLYRSKVVSVSSGTVESYLRNAFNEAAKSNSPLEIRALYLGAWNEATRGYPGSPPRAPGIYRDGQLVSIPHYYTGSAGQQETIQRNPRFGPEGELTGLDMEVMGEAFQSWVRGYPRVRSTIANRPENIVSPERNMPDYRDWIIQQMTKPTGSNGIQWPRDKVEAYLSAINFDERSFPEFKAVPKSYVAIDRRTEQPTRRFTPMMESPSTQSPPLFRQRTPPLGYASAYDMQPPKAPSFQRETPIPWPSGFNPELDFPKIQVISSPSFAKLLVQQMRGKTLDLSSVRSIDAAIAAVLATHKGLLKLSGITTLDTASATALTKHSGEIKCTVSVSADTSADVVQKLEGLGVTIKKSEQAQVESTPAPAPEPTLPPAPTPAPAKAPATPEPPTPTPSPEPIPTSTPEPTTEPKINAEPLTNIDMDIQAARERITKENLTKDEFSSLFNLAVEFSGSIKYGESMKDIMLDLKEKVIKKAKEEIDLNGDLGRIAEDRMKLEPAISAFIYEMLEIHGANEKLRKDAGDQLKLAQDEMLKKGRRSLQFP